MSPLWWPTGWLYLRRYDGVEHLMTSRERKTLQPWVKWALHDPRTGWVCWKVEDAYLPGLPDFIVKSPKGTASLLEIKWATTMGVVPFDLSREQLARLREWGAGAHVLVAVPLVGQCYVVPIEALRAPLESLLPGDAARLPGCSTCAFDRRKLMTTLRAHLM